MTPAPRERVTPDRGIDILAALGCVVIVCLFAYFTGALPLDPPNPTKAIDAAMKDCK